MVTKQERAEELIEAMRKKRGYLYAEWEFAARLDPEFMQVYDALYERAAGDGEALPAKYKELAAMAILAFRGEQESLRNHIQRALKLGLTKQEILEAFQAAMVPGGAVTFLHGLRALYALEREEQPGA
ncbi:MAG: carboxymuconolactone decarboxylase family protein [Deltaproteobacteria bacterium]|nr:carboxymuconolactone decarboxylase family protein [Deltaproteobacteria bacterium]